MNMLSPKKTKFRKQFKGRIHESKEILNSTMEVTV